VLVGAYFTTFLSGILRDASGTILCKKFFPFQGDLVKKGLLI
jgi:hypothetical protein